MAVVRRKLTGRPLALGDRDQIRDDYEYSNSGYASVEQHIVYSERGALEEADNRVLHGRGRLRVHDHIRLRGLQRLRRRYYRRIARCLRHYCRWACGRYLRRRELRGRAGYRIIVRVELRVLHGNIKLLADGCLVRVGYHVLGGYGVHVHAKLVSDTRQGVTRLHGIRNKLYVTE